MSSVVISGDTSGQVTLAAPAVAGTNTITLPASTGTVALTSQLGGMTLLGTIATTSGTTVSLTGLTLTNYKQLLFVINSVNTSSGSATTTIGSGLNIASAKLVFSGQAWVDLTTGGGSAITNGMTSNATNVYIGATGYSTATTSVSVTTVTGNFGGGSILVYGVA